MKVKLTLFILILIAAILAENKKYALDASISIQKNITEKSKIFFPVPSISFYWLKTKAIHELSGEFYFREIEKGNPNLERRYLVLGMTYSYLVKLPFKYIYLGPTLGFLEYDSHDYNPNNYMSNQESYFLGCKIVLLFGEDKFRFKIQNRLLVGLFEGYDDRNYGLAEALSIGLVVAF